MVRDDHAPSLSSLLSITKAQARERRRACVFAYMERETMKIRLEPVTVASRAAVERLEREYHKKRIYLSVVEANRPAAALYESFGFRFTGERDTHGERVMCLRTR